MVLEEDADPLALRLVAPASVEVDAHDRPRGWRKLGQFGQAPLRVHGSGAPPATAHRWHGRLAVRPESLVRDEILLGTAREIASLAAFPGQFALQRLEGAVQRKPRPGRQRARVLGRAAGRLDGHPATDVDASFWAIDVGEGDDGR